MALPVQINAAEANFRFAGAENAAEPGIYTFEGAVFVVCYDDGNDNAEIWFDEGPTRGEGFMEADGANHPDVYTGGTQAHRKPASCVVGSTIYVAHLDTSGDLAVTPFSMPTKTWGSIVTGGPTKADIGSNTALAILPIPGESLRLAYNGDQISSFDSIYFVDLGIDEVWGGQTVLHDGSGTDDYYLYAAVQGFGGLTHFFYQLPSSLELFHRSVEPDGTKNAEQSVVTLPTTANIAVGWDCGDSYFDGGASVMKLAIPFNYWNMGSPSSEEHEFKIALADSEAEPSWTLEKVTSDPIHYQSDARQAKAACFIDGAIYHAMVGAVLVDIPPSTGDRDLYLAVKSGASWNSPLKVYDDASLNVLRPRIRQIDIGYAIVFEMVIGGFAKSFYYEAAVDPCPALVARSYVYSGGLALMRG